MMMAQTISVHNGNSATVGQEHNAREAEYLKYHVNQEHVIPDGYHKSIIHEPLEEAINRIFADALEEYNRKKRADKKHPGREIDNYYQHLTSQLEENKKRKAVKGNKAGFEAMQPCYEVIVQIGNCNTVNSRTNLQYDPKRLDPELAEELLMEAIERTKKRFTVPAVDKNGKPICDENGVQKTWCCIEIVGLYIHDDEIQKGIHAHVDYVPVAHNYRRGLSMQPGLNNALTEMGLTADRIEDLAADRTRLMMEKYGIEYHDSDYMDEKGKQISKAKLTKEQLLHRKMASELVPCKTPQMKFQELFRDNLREVMQEREVPTADSLRENRAHQDKHEWKETKAILEANQNARQERDRLLDEKENAAAAYEEQVEKGKADLAVLEEKKAALTSWDKKPKTEKELMDRIDKEATVQKKGLLSQEGIFIPAELWKHIKSFLKSHFRLEEENRKLKKSTSFAKVKTAEKIMASKEQIVADARKEAEAIRRDAINPLKRGKLMQENQELKKLVEFYERAIGRNPELSEAVEREKMRNEIRRKKDHEIAV